MSLRRLILDNFHWKLTALLLALLVWSAIKFAIDKEKVTNGANQVLRRQAVMVLKAPDDPRVFRIDPPRVDVIVEATKRLNADDIELFVNLTTMPDVSTALKPIQVRSSDATKVVRVEPSFILVERVSPMETSLTNSFKP